MAEAHKRSYRHPKYKTAYRINNWREYDKALRYRGDVTFGCHVPLRDACTKAGKG